MIDELKKAFMHSWTGGASGAPNRYHGPGAFDDFRFADLFDNDRWVREKMPFVNPKSDRQMETAYYVPREEVIPPFVPSPDASATYPEFDKIPEVTPQARPVPIRHMPNPHSGRWPASYPRLGQQSNLRTRLQRPFWGRPPVTGPYNPNSLSSYARYYQDRIQRIAEAQSKANQARTTIVGEGRTRPPMLTPSQRQAIPRLPGVGRTRPPMLSPSQRQSIPRFPASTRPLLPPTGGAIANRPSIPQSSGPVLRPNVPRGTNRGAYPGPTLQRNVPRSANRGAYPGPALQRNVPRGVNRGAYPNAHWSQSLVKQLPGVIWDGLKWVSRSPLGLGVTGLLHSPDVGANSEVVPENQFFSFDMGQPYKPPSGLGPHGKRVTTETPDGKVKTVTTEETDPIQDNINMGTSLTPEFQYIPEAGEQPTIPYQMTPEEDAASAEFEQQRLNQQAQDYMEANPYYGEQRLLPEIPWESIGEGLGEFKDDVIQGNPLLKKILGWWD